MSLRNQNDFLITIDTDWAPDAILMPIAQYLVENQVKSTWFITNHSDTLAFLRSHTQLFELGIHPNCLENSTHGKTEEEVMTHIKSIVPEAISMRTHGLYQSSTFLFYATSKYNIRIDSSLFVPFSAQLKPYVLKWGDLQLMRIPFYWEDDYEMTLSTSRWKLSEHDFTVPGLKVFNFHPVHIALNNRSFTRYRQLQKIRPLHLWDDDFINQHCTKKAGTRTLFLDLVSLSQGHGKKINEFDLHLKKR